MIQFSYSKITIILKNKRILDFILKHFPEGVFTLLCDAGWIMCEHEEQEGSQCLLNGIGPSVLMHIHLLLNDSHVFKPITCWTTNHLRFTFCRRVKNLNFQALCLMARIFIQVNWYNLPTIKCSDRLRAFTFCINILLFYFTPLQSKWGTLGIMAFFMVLSEARSPSVFSLRQYSSILFLSQGYT